MKSASTLTRKSELRAHGSDFGSRLIRSQAKRLARLENGIFQPVPNDLGRLPIQTLMTDSHGMIWASIAGGGLWRIEPGTDQVSQLPPENGRPLPNIQQIFEDREGNIWLATSEGLERLSDVKVITYTTRDGLPSDNVGTVASGSDGRIWIGTSRGLAYLKKGKVERTSLGSKEEPVPPMEVTSIYEDPQGVLWFGTRDGGLHRLQNGQDQRVAALNREGGPGYAMGICNNRAGDLLVGTAGAGLQVFRNGQLVRTFSSADGLRNRSIFSLTIDREEAVWIGETPGVDVLRGSTISVPGENAEMLSKTTILSTYDDPDATVWAGGVNGLYRLRAGKWALVAFRPDERVLAPEFFCLLEDDNGNLWSSGSRGIFCVSKRELNEFFDGKRSSVSCRAFGKADGLKSPDCSNVYYPAGCRLPDGRLAFGTIAGLAVIDPNHLQFNSLLPAVQIEQVVADLTHVLPIRAGNQSIQLGPGAHYLEFDYAGLSFTAPEKVRFKYRLDGFDKDWIDAGTSAEAHYTNLAPGTYRFRVIACNNDGLWVPEESAARMQGLHYYWSVSQSEYATDVLFDEPKNLQPLYRHFIHHAVKTFQSPDVMRFLGNRYAQITGKVHPLFKGELTTRLKERPEGVRLRHTFNGNSLKLYDKERCVLRSETTIIHPEAFKVYRPKEGEPDGQKQWRKLRRGVADLYRRAQVSYQANDRYLEALASISGTSPLRDQSAAVCKAVLYRGRRYRALNPLAQADYQLLRAVGRGEFTLTGMRNADLRALLFKPTQCPHQRRRNSAAVTRQLALLRAHGLLKKIPHTHRYQLTKNRRQILTALLAACDADVEQLTKIAA